MKKSISAFALTAIATMFVFAGCKKEDSTPPSSSGKAIFTAKIAGDPYSAPDSSYVLNGAGGTIAVFSNDANKRGFQMAIFEKDFPVGKAVGIAYSPSLAYRNAKGILYIAKEGSLTISEYGKVASGGVNHLVGTFTATMTADGDDIQITEGKFDVRTK